jgi:hypothetical protein
VRGAAKTEREPPPYSPRERCEGWIRITIAVAVPLAALVCGLMLLWR